MECYWAVKIKRHKTHSHKLIRLEKINGRRNMRSLQEWKPHYAYRYIFQMNNNQSGVLSYVCDCRLNNNNHPNEFHFLPLIASTVSACAGLLFEVASNSSIKLNAFFWSTRDASREMYSFELRTNIVYDIFNLFVGEYRLLLKYALAAGERKKSCSILYLCW